MDLTLFNIEMTGSCRTHAKNSEEEGVTTDLCNAVVAWPRTGSWIEASLPAAWQLRPAGPTRRKTEASPPAAEPGRAPRRNGLVSEAWGSSPPSSARRLQETPPPASGRAREAGEEGVEGEETFKWRRGRRGRREQSGE